MASHAPRRAGSRAHLAHRGLQQLTLLLGLALEMGSSAQATAATIAPAKAPGTSAASWTTRWERALTLDLGFDSNARRASADRPTFLVTPDLLAYSFGRLAITTRRPGQLLRGELQLGAKLFAATSAEDMFAARARLSYQQALSRRSLISSSVAYSDKFQRGDNPLAVANTELACSSSGSIPSESLRCNARDYRSVSLSFGPSVRLSRRVGLGLSLGLLGFAYKPSRQFSYLAPSLATELRMRLGHHALALALALSHRSYHPDSVTWEKVPSGSGTVVVARATPRQEWSPSTQLIWSWKGRFLWKASAGLARTLNNSFGLDAWRLRLDLSLAAHLSKTTRLLLGLGLQSSIYPEGNILRGLSLVADQSEQQNSLTLKLSQRLSSWASLTLKGQAYTNEISGEVLPFRRGVAQLGLDLVF